MTCLCYAFSDYCGTTTSIFGTRDNATNIMNSVQNIYISNVNVAFDFNKENECIGGGGGGGGRGRRGQRKMQFTVFHNVFVRRT